MNWFLVTLVLMGINPQWREIDRVGPLTNLECNKLIDGFKATQEQPLILTCVMGDRKF